MLGTVLQRPSSTCARSGRTSRNLDTLGLEVLGVTRGLAVPLSELFAVVQLQDTHKGQPPYSQLTFCCAERRDWLTLTLS